MLEIKVPMLYNDGEVIIMDLKQLRTEKGLTQVGCSRYLQIPLRTYKRYENDVRLVNTIKYRYIVERLRNYVESCVMDVSALTVAPLTE